MPGRGSRQALHQLCDSVSGANWRPTRFQDELTVLRYACCVCHVIPNTTVVLPCSHILCEQCQAGCVIQDGGSVCPIDTEPFCEDECQKLKLPEKKKRNLKAHCWNEAYGCEFVGTIENVLQHFDRECAFHALQCTRCQQRILRRDIAAHYVAGCPQKLSCPGGVQADRQDGSSTSCNMISDLDSFSALQRQLNEVSARSQDISLVISGIANSLQRGMESIEKNICTTVARDMIAVLEELKASNKDECSDRLPSFQSRLNELLEDSRHRNASDLQEIERMLRGTHSEVKEDMKSQLQEILHVMRAYQSEVRETVKTQLHEVVNVTEELKEHVGRVETNLSSMLTDQGHFLENAFGVTEQKQTFNRSAVFGTQEIPWRFKQNVLIDESLKTLELLRHQIYRHEKELWVSNITHFPSDSCTFGGKDFRPRGFDVTLENAGNIFKSVKRVFTVAKHYYSDMCFELTFSSSERSPFFYVKVECVKTWGTYDLPFLELSVKVVRRSSGEFILFLNQGDTRCSDCCYKGNLHFLGWFSISNDKLGKDDVVKDGKLTLKFEFRGRDS
uniref:Putative tnf receptor-associated factor 6 n=1 Tax=Rhipicephalus microplus TaxID=6941 RepID=A0A6M2CJ62_RHIMP